jgi:hypothetical protein
VATIEPLVCTGTFEDEHGTEAVDWLIVPLVEKRWDGFEIRATIRGVEVRGYDFDGLEAVDEEAARAVGIPTDLVDFRMTAHTTCTVTVAGVRTTAALDFTFSYFRTSNATLTLSLTAEGHVYQAADKSFEDCLERIEATFPNEIQLTSCLTCRWSSYQQYAWNVMGMRCGRDAKDQVLAALARNKHAQDQVSVAEYVPEMHLCGEYERRVPSTVQRASRKPDAAVRPRETGRTSTP